MTFVKELNQEFKTKKELFNALRTNKDAIIDAKRSRIMKSHEKGLGLKVKSLIIKENEDQIKGLDIDENYYYLAVNTTKILDSHEDLHVNGIWNKSVKDQQGKLYLVLDHQLKVSATVVKKENIEIFVAEIPFKMIGKDYEGNTEALIYKFKKEDVINETAKNWLESGDEIEASVRMQYVKITLALNSTEKEDVEYKAEYDKYFPQIANKEDFEEIDFFFVVKEAKNVGESSLVLFGSNSATGIIEDDNEIKNIILNTKKQLKSNLSSNLAVQEATTLLKELISEIEKKPPKSTSTEPPQSTQKIRSVRVLRMKKN